MSTQDQGGIMGTAIAKPLGALERVLIGGDLSRLSEQERLEYYQATCVSLGLNPLTKPFDYIELNGKLVLYAKRDCTDQLRKVHGISVKILSREVAEGVYVVTAQARTADGREDESIGAVPIVKEGGEWKSGQGGKRFFQGDGRYIPLKPEDRANAIMKAETKSKRRVTLSICGLGMLDESELDTIGEVRARQQAAQDDVRDKKLAQIGNGEELPDGLLNLLALVDGGEAKQALDIAYGKMKALGQAGLGAWEARTKAMKAAKQGNNIPLTAVKECLKGLWTDGASLEAAKAADAGMPVEEEPAQ